MDLQQQILEVFKPGGVLSGATDQFMPREGQTRMALAVGHAIEQGGALVVEAGTGIGKTFAYLVPALLSGERVLLSTATKTLQDQLFARDLPRLAEALGLPVRSALLKGRASYLCLHRLAQARQDSHVADQTSREALARIERWSNQTRSGDMAELPDLDERSPLMPRVTSTRENCLGAGCPELKDCYVNLARRNALAADVVVVNHHLFFADIVVRQSGMAELLPTVQVVIFDEAHQLNDIGVSLSGIQLSTGQLTDFARDLLAVGWRLARGLADWQGLAAEVDGAARQLDPGHYGLRPAAGRLRWDDPVVDALSLRDTLAALEQSCERCAETLAPLAEMDPELARLQEWGTELARLAGVFAGTCGADVARWIDVGAQVRLVQAPLDIADVMQKQIVGAAGEQHRRRSWIFTSATLGTDAELRWFTEPCRLSQATILKIQSPFDYAQQASVYVPADFALPDDKDHSTLVARLAANSARQLGGRTLVLTTTLRALRTVGLFLKSEFADADMGILVQGELPKRELMERFRPSQGSTTPRCVLVASISFWQGIDVPGEALQLVIIDKLPFPPPNDPLVEARSLRAKAAGRSAFSDYLIPETALALKQGAGRLIRRETDRGILVVCDNRLNTRGYGKRLMAALPPMQRLGTAQEFQIALEVLTTISTKAATQT